MSSQPTKQALLDEVPQEFDTDTLRFDGLRGTRAAHLSAEALESRLAALEPAPRHHGGHRDQKLVFFPRCEVHVASLFIATRAWEQPLRPQARRLPA